METTTKPKAGWIFDDIAVTENNELAIPNEHVPATLGEFLGDFDAGISHPQLRRRAEVLYSDTAKAASTGQVEQARRCVIGLGQLLDEDRAMTGQDIIRREGLPAEYGGLFPAGSEPFRIRYTDGNVWDIYPFKEERDIPLDAVRILEREERAGLVFDEFWIAHERALPRNAPPSQPTRKNLWGLGTRVLTAADSATGAAIGAASGAAMAARSVVRAMAADPAIIGVVRSNPCWPGHGFILVRWV